MKVTPTKKKRSKKGLIIGLIAVIILGAGIAAYYLTRPQQDTPTNQTTDKPQTNNPGANKPDANQTDATDKQKFLDDQTEKDKNNSNNTPPVKQPPKTPPAISLSAKTSGNTVVIATDLTSTPSGTCTLTITGGSTPVTKTAQVLYTPEYSTCAGFSIAKDEVSAGTWTIKLDVSSPAGTQTKTITYTP